MSFLDRFFFPHTVSVADRVGGAGMGAGYGPPRAVPAEVKDEAHLVRNADGEEVVSSSIVTVPLTANVAAGALVTVWPGTPAEREALVVVGGRDENNLPLPSHLVLHLE